MKHKTYKLDPAIEKQLFATPSELDARVQELLDNPSQIAPFMDFRVDWSFKYILGHEEAMIKLLNDILPVHVDTLEYLPNEIPVRSEKEKRAVFDVICTNKTTKEKFLCEMQRLPESDMDDRLLFYGCSLIQKQIKRKDKKYILNTVYVICVADYERAHPTPVPADDFLFKYRLRDERWPEDVMTTKLQFYYLELPRFQKGWEAAQTNAERWCYLFRNLYKFAGVPRDASDFEPIFEIARTEQFEEEQLKVYLNAMVTDYEKLVIGEYHEQKGFKEGLEQGRAEGREQGRAEGGKERALNSARNMLARGYEVSEIAEVTELTPEEINALQQ
jgi:predicted transposase/invertase (TIGR01784 family)